MVHLVPWQVGKWLAGRSNPMRCVAVRRRGDLVYKITQSQSRFGEATLQSTSGVTRKFARDLLVDSPNKNASSLY